MYFENEESGLKPINKNKKCLKHYTPQLFTPKNTMYIKQPLFNDDIKSSLRRVLARHK